MSQKTNITAHAEAPEKRDPPLKAYAVLENEENTGSIYFAQHAITARKAGANEYADGDISQVKCTRAPWADRFAEVRDVPISEMIWNGWHFECCGCGERISQELPDAWEDRLLPETTPREMVRMRARYKRWTPDHAVGSQRSSAFCDAQCAAEYEAHEAERARRQNRAISAFKHLVRKRFPDAVIPSDDPDPALPFYRQHSHAYAEYAKGLWRLRQIRVDFEFPGMTIGPACLRYDSGNSGTPRAKRMPAYQCCAGDSDAFEAWATEGVPDLAKGGSQG